MYVYCMHVRMNVLFFGLTITYYLCIDYYGGGGGGVTIYLTIYCIYCIYYYLYTKMERLVEQHTHTHTHTHTYTRTHTYTHIHIS